MEMDNIDNHAKPHQAIIESRVKNSKGVPGITLDTILFNLLIMSLDTHRNSNNIFSLPSKRVVSNYNLESMKPQLTYLLKE